ncbi:Actin-related protein 4 [Thecaphora frezii]
MPGIYGGDEINAIVIDPGYSQTRAGWAGEDTPRAVIPSFYGYSDISDHQIAQLERHAAYLDPAATNPPSATDADGDQTMHDATQSTPAPASADAAPSASSDSPADPSASASASTATANGHGAGTLTEDSDYRLKANRARAAKKALLLVDREKKRRRYVGDADLNFWRPDMEIANPFDHDGILAEVPAFQSLCTHSLDILSCDARHHPLLMTEPAWNSKEARERMTEIAFETLEVPAFYLANRTVLSSFAAGKPTSLLVDVGANTLSCIPVVDGFVLRKGIQRQDNGGDSVSRALLYSLTHELRSPTDAFTGLTPQFLIKSRTAVEAGTEPQIKLRDDRIASTRASYLGYQTMRMVADFKASTAQTLETPWDEAQARLRPTKAYEFASGYNDFFGSERYKAAETVFTPSLWSGCVFSNSVAGTAAQQGSGVLIQGKAYEGLTQMVLNAVNASDVDSRPALFGNVVVVGAGSFLPGLTDRLSYELGVAAPNQKIKIHAPGNATERRHSSWLGGSILASLGTFHQLWISKQEYDEHGPAVVHARCK